MRVYLHNKFVNHMASLKEEITVSDECGIELSTHNKPLKMSPGKILITSDVWSADTTKTGFIGMTAHWIEVKERKWTLRVEVIGFKTLSGAHSGENLGRHAVGLLDQVGIMGRKLSKVCCSIA
jgi:hypothetical protein